MEVQIHFHKETSWLRRQTIRQRLQRVLEDLGQHESEVSLLFTDDDQMAQLNERYLGRKGPTNVMAFPMRDGLEPAAGTSMLGDVVISIDTALRESEELQEDPEHTVDRLLIHGLLHLLGFDHEGSPTEAKRMQREEERLLRFMRGE